MSHHSKLQEACRRYPHLDNVYMREMGFTVLPGNGTALHRRSLALNWSSVKVRITRSS